MTHCPINVAYEECEEIKEVLRTHEDIYMIESLTDVLLIHP